MALTRQELRDFLATKTRADLSKVGDDDELFSSGVIDSFAMVDLLTFLEKYTKTRLGFEDIDMDNVDSVSGILRFAASKTKQ
ncbi:MAG: phosphopantetheine-binding protein [Nannocystaceae bacterium]